jgi:hypothetical protein
MIYVMVANEFDGGDDDLDVVNAHQEDLMNIDPPAWSSEGAMPGTEWQGHRHRTTRRTRGPWRTRLSLYRL